LGGKERGWKRETCLVDVRERRTGAGIRGEELRHLRYLGEDTGGRRANAAQDRETIRLEVEVKRRPPARV